MKQTSRAQHDPPDPPFGFCHILPLIVAFRPEEKVPCPTESGHWSQPDRAYKGKDKHNKVQLTVTNTRQILHKISAGSCDLYALRTDLPPLLVYRTWHLDRKVTTTTQCGLRLNCFAMSLISCSYMFMQKDSAKKLYRSLQLGGLDAVSCLIRFGESFSRKGDVSAFCGKGSKMFINFGGF